MTLLASVHDFIIACGQIAWFITQNTPGKLVGGAAAGAALMESLRALTDRKGPTEGLQPAAQANEIIKRRRQNRWIWTMVIFALAALAAFIALDISGGGDSKRTRPLELWEAVVSILAPVAVAVTIIASFRLRALNR